MEHALMPSVVTDIQDELKGRVRCIVVTPEKAFLDKIVEMVIVPMYDGELGVLAGRAPIIGRLGAGELRLKDGSSVERYFVEAGFVQVRSNVVTVLTSKAVKATEITPDMAVKASEAAEALPFANAVERANKAKARDRAAGMKRVAAKNGT
jgi:F-type H+-transporting ATPase subunit epsilon